MSTEITAPAEQTNERPETRTPLVQDSGLYTAVLENVRLAFRAGEARVGRDDSRESAYPDPPTLARTITALLEGVSPSTGTPTDAHRAVVQSVKAHTGCTHGQAMAVLGDVSGVVSQVHMTAYNKGCNDALSRPSTGTGERPEPSLVASAEARDRAWMEGVNRACGQELEFDPLGREPGKPYRPTLEEFVTGLREERDRLSAEVERLRAELEAAREQGMRPHAENVAPLCDDCDEHHVGPCRGRDGWG